MKAPSPQEGERGLGVRGRASDGVPHPTSEVMSDLTQYLAFTERVDRFFHWNLTLAKHIRDLRSLYRDHPHLQNRPYDPGVLSQRDEILEEMLFSFDFSDKFSVLNFVDPEHPALSIDNPDPVNFAFYSCYCFQWNLFETFVKAQVFSLCDGGILDQRMEKKLLAIGRNQTEALLKFLDSGEVFGKTPFVNLIEEGLSAKNPDKVTYRDLDAIRVQRNNFVHGIESPEIKAATFEEKEAEYERMHQILTQFAVQVDLGVQKLRRGAAR